MNPPAPSDLTFLDLKMLREGRGLGEILALTPRLRELRWQWDFSLDFPHNNRDSAVLNLDKIVADLLHVRRSLTKLTITAEAHHYSGPTCSDRAHPIAFVLGSFEPLRTFESLTTLKIPLAFLVGSITRANSQPLGPSLPRNLESLTVTDDLCDWEVKDKLWFDATYWYEPDQRWCVEETRLLRTYFTHSEQFSPRLRRLCFALEQTLDDTVAALVHALSQMREEIRIGSVVVDHKRGPPYHYRELWVIVPPLSEDTDSCPCGRNFDHWRCTLVPAGAADLARYDSTGEFRG